MKGKRGRGEGGERGVHTRVGGVSEFPARPHSNCHLCHSATQIRAHGMLEGGNEVGVHLDGRYMRHVSTAEYD